MIQTYLKRKSFDSYEKNRGRPRRKFTDAHMHAMISPEALEENKFLTIAQRSKKLFDDLGLYVEPTSLRMLYKRHGINWKMARVQPKNVLRNSNKHENDRIAFSKTLVSCLVNNLDLAYVDETTVQVQQQA